MWVVHGDMVWFRACCDRNRRKEELSRETRQGHCLVLGIWHCWSWEGAVKLQKSSMDLKFGPGKGAAGSGAFICLPLNSQSKMR